MRLALIPPPKWMATFGFRTDYHMLLPAFMHDEDYMRTVHRSSVDSIRSVPDYRGYFILDNGENEGAKLAHAELLAVATELSVDELVLPDKMHNAPATLQLVQEFLEVEEQRRRLYRVPGFEYMGVVQGVSVTECMELITRYNELPQIGVLGIPRHLIQSVETSARAQICARTRQMFGSRFDIHLLGTNPRFLAELVMFKNTFELCEVRGVDTSAPFNYALADRRIVDDTALHPTNRLPGVNRPKDYESTPYDVLKYSAVATLVEDNINTLLQWTV